MLIGKFLQAEAHNSPNSLWIPMVDIITTMPSAAVVANDDLGFNCEVIALKVLIRGLVGGCCAIVAEDAFVLHDNT